MTELKTQQTAVYELEYAPDGTTIRDKNNAHFDMKSYSRMKYGSRIDTQHYAQHLVNTFSEDAPQLFETEEAPAFLVAFKAVQPACGYLTRYCLDRVNQRRVGNGLEPADMIRVYKDSVTNTDYSTATTAERTAELASIDFTLEGKRIDDRDVVILDDIRISGGAERRILEALSAEQQLPRTVLLGYIAVFDAHQAADSPHVESQINTTAMKGAEDLISLITAETGFDLNIRTLKMILALSGKELDNVLHVMTQEQLEQTVRGAVDTGPSFVEKYSEGYARLLQYVNEQHEQGATL